MVLSLQLAGGSLIIDTHILFMRAVFDEDNDEVAARFARCQLQSLQHKDACWRANRLYKKT